LNNIQQMIFNYNMNPSIIDGSFRVLEAEQEFIIHPSALGLLPLNLNSLNYPFTCEFSMKDYHLYLNRIVMPKSYSQCVSGELISAATVNNVGEETEYQYNDFKVSYNGAILIGTNPVKDYNMKGQRYPCFSYQKVYELIYENGILITSVDQSKAMIRIRKNLELGLRSLYNNRDLRCIKRFMNSSFVGDYKPFVMKGRRLHYVKDMMKTYSKYMSQQDMSF
jgi:hypothetical protein